MVGAEAHEIIYAYLHDEALHTWRPIDAVSLGDLRYRITDPRADEDEVWESQPGDVVRCGYRTLSDGQTLVAVEKVADHRT